MSDAGGLTHFDESGAARMVDVSLKPESKRTAVARAVVRMSAQTLARIRAGTAGKGDVLGVARLGGVAGAKHAAQAIPLCHPVRLTAVDLRFQILPELPGVEVEAEVAAFDRTGPEMEAMSAAAAAALTIYDMCKAVDRSMAIEEVVLLTKSGGKSGDWVRPA